MTDLTDVFHPFDAANPGRRFADDIVRLHDRLNFRGLPDAIDGEPLVRLDGFGDGLITLSVRQSQLPRRYLQGVMGFRLAQFLKMGWMDPELTYRRALYHEPVIPTAGPETIHTLTMTETGRIVGYVALVGSTDPAPLPLDTTERRLFPAEVAHHVDLLSRFAGPGRNTHQVVEIKRFVRSLSLVNGDPHRDRVPWHLMLAIGKVPAGSNHPIEFVVGDSRENGALRHLRMVGFDPVVIDNTAPNLPHTELMWPSYEQPELAKPFVSTVPSQIGSYLQVIEDGLRADSATDWRRSAVLKLMALHGAARIPRPSRRLVA